MKITIDRKILLERLRLCREVANTKMLNVVLRCVRLTAADGSLKLEATNLERSVSTSVEHVVVEVPGVTCVRADELREAVEGFGDDSVVIEFDKHMLVIGDRNGGVRLNTVDPSNFPSLPHPVGRTFEMSGEQFAKGFDAVARAVADTGTRYAFNGVFLAPNGGMVATDARRLHIFGKPDEPTAKEPATILPVEAMKIVNLLEAESVAITISPSAVSFAADETTITSNLIEGSFPPFSEMIQKGTNTSVVVSAEGFVDLIDRGSFAAIKEITPGKDVIARKIRMEITADGVTVSASSSARGNSICRMAVKVDGPPLVVGFNPDFLKDAIRACRGGADGEVKIGFTSPNRPLQIEGGETVAILMPATL